MVKRLYFIFILTFLTFLESSTFAKPTKNRKPSVRYAEPLLQAAIKRSEMIQANFSALYDRAYDRYSGFFEEVIPKVELYQKEVKLLKEAYVAWIANNTAPLENLMWHLPGMVFDLEENEQVLAESFVQTAKNRILAQEKSIRQEINRINKLIETEQSLKPFPKLTLTELLNLTTSRLTRPLQEVIVKLNYTTSKPPTENATDDEFVEAIFSVASLEEQLSDLVDLEVKVIQFWNSLVKLSKMVDGSGRVEVDVHNQRYRYLEMVVGKAVQRANRTFKKVVKDGAEMRAFEEYIRALGATASRMVGN